VFGATEAAGHAWADELLRAIVNEGFAAFWERLIGTRSRLPSPASRLAVDKLTRYAGERREKMDYPAFRSQGLSIGSGPTESMCKALGRRLKEIGMRWQPANAQAMATLEALHQSDGWRGYWSSRCAAHG
jgi:hypothetical protein